jgi:hypothetical protein
MSARDLKNILHKQIDLVEKEDDLQDLLMTVSEFVQFRVQDQLESPELIAQLNRALASIKKGQTTSHNQIIIESKQWITR